MPPRSLGLKPSGYPLHCRVKNPCVKPDAEVDFRRWTARAGSGRPALLSKDCARRRSRPGNRTSSGSPGQPPQNLPACHWPLQMRPRDAFLPCWLFLDLAALPIAYGARWIWRRDGHISPSLFNNSLAEALPARRRKSRGVALSQSRTRGRKRAAPAAGKNNSPA